MLEKLLVGLATAVLTFVATWFWASRSERAKTLSRITELEAQMRVMSQSVEPIYTAMQSLLVKKLTHLHTPVTDRLLVKLGPPNMLTDEEERILFAAIKARITNADEGIDDEERDAATIFPVIVRYAKLEAKLVKQK